MSVVVDGHALGSQILDALCVDVVDLDHVVGVEVVVVVLLGDDSLRVQVVAVDRGDDGLVVLMMHVVLDDKSAASGKVLLDLLVDDHIVVLDPS